jgi:hypothetical protein
MKQADSVGVTFINYVAGRGVINGVCNLTLGTFAFDPSEDGKTIEVAPYISARLRMDVPTARAIHAELTTLLQSIDSLPTTENTLPPPEPLAQTNGDGSIKPLN